MNTSFSVKIGQFEGPLELLLNLIEERKMLVSDVSLAQVADDFLSYIGNEVAFPVGAAAHFILVAATLLLLKSRALLPVLSLSEEEEGDVKDLEFRLTLYQQFRHVARRIGGFNMHMFFGQGSRIVDPVFTPSRDLSKRALVEAMNRVLQNAPQKTLTPEVSVKSIVSLEEMIERLSKRIKKAIHLSFRDFAGADAVDKREMVIGFLAVLELVKRGLVLVEQERSFGEIAIAYNGSVKAPRYE